MTCGIYKLVFNGTTKSYIGQSLNIESRYRDHVYFLNKGLHSAKLQSAYNMYGLPTFEIVEDCDGCNSEELNATEDFYIKKLRSYEEGFNTLEHAAEIPILRGESHGRALYSDYQIEETFLLLVKEPPLLYSKISEITGVSVSNIYLISNGSNHLWLKSKYPIEYQQLLNKIGTRRGSCQSLYNTNKILPKLISPSGEIVEILSSIREFSRLHNLDDGHLGKVLHGKVKSHKGWTRAEASKK